jgi:Helix-turn-helix of insertion element transposase
VDKIGQNRTEGEAEAPDSSATPCSQARPWKWNKKRETAAVLIAEDELADQEIADKVGVSRSQLGLWKHVPEFKARVEQLVKQFGKVALRNPIARVNRRVRNYDRRLTALEQVFVERAADETMQQVPGGRTGLLVRQVKGIGKGQDFREVQEYAVDTRTLREMRELEKQAAIELGQWTEKKDIKGTFECLSDAELDQRIAELEGRIRGASGRAGPPAAGSEPTPSGPGAGLGTGGHDARPLAGVLAPFFPPAPANVVLDEAAREGAGHSDAHRHSGGVEDHGGFGSR